MNISKKIITSSTIILTLYSCGFDKFGEWDISEVYAQKIEGTSKILYKYDAWGGRDSNANGFIILDSTETFKIDLNNALPFYNLSEIPNKSKIEGIKHECYNSCSEEYYKTEPIFSPMKIDNFQFKGINIKNIVYQYRGISERNRGLRGDFVFEKFVETKDSIYFFNLKEEKYVDNKHLDELKLKKGEVYLSENEAGEITKIVINQITLNPRNKDIIEVSTYFLTSKNKIKSSDFSDRGIFKEIKITK
ncbi:hypothetical protein SAMN02927937_00709 [Paenimyroides aquimaris]|uniref:Lipoprotein n=1 Tax=Paenimyroides marinum TaxID=1159016 RepID=A0A1H6K1X7_9FLAO|nr:hypothetical protein [Paenimyroides aquimaris]SEH65537.1 hypothetical protein SAMN02927937_00709 [Paenimyroides aquimaris]